MTGAPRRSNETVWLRPNTTEENARLTATRMTLWGGGALAALALVAWGLMQTPAHIVGGLLMLLVVMAGLVWSLIALATLVGWLGLHAVRRPAVDAWGDVTGVRITAGTITVHRRSGDAEVARTVDGDFRVEGNELVVGESRLDLSGVNIPRLVEEAESLGWGAPRPDEPTQVAPAGETDGWSQPPWTKPTRSRKVRDYAAFAAEGLPEVTLTDEKRWRWRPVPAAAWCFLVGSAVVVLGSVAWQTGLWWTAVLGASAFLAGSVPAFCGLFFLVLGKSWPYGHHPDVSRRWTIQVDDRRLRVQRESSDRRQPRPVTFYRGAGLRIDGERLWNEKSSVTVPDLPGDEVARLLRERAWNVEVASHEGDASARRGALSRGE